MTPLYEHDCDRCVFLGTAVWQHRLCDWYVCPQGGWPTVVRRYSDEPSGYDSSETFFGDIWKALGTEVAARAFYLMRHWRKHYNRRERMKLKRRRVRRERRAYRRFTEQQKSRDFEGL